MVRSNGDDQAMVRSGQEFFPLNSLLSGPQGALISQASETMQALKLGFRIELSEVPADEFAVMCCIERESNKYQIEQMKAQRNGSPSY